MVNEAVLRTVRLGRTEVLQEDLMEAADGHCRKGKKDRIFNPRRNGGLPSMRPVMPWLRPYNRTGATVSRRETTPHFHSCQDTSR
jgi:hypothetical protein